MKNLNHTMSLRLGSIAVAVGMIFPSYAQAIYSATDSVAKVETVVSTQEVTVTGVDSITTEITLTEEFASSIAQPKHKSDNPYRFKPTQLIVPAAFIGIGAIGVSNGWLKSINEEVKDGLTKNNHNRLRIDDVSLILPTATVYVLDLCGIKGKNTVVDQTIILGTAFVLMGVTVEGTKLAVNACRPDGSDYKSFPSGHTAIAFMGAEFLRREYAHISPWIGVGGYAVAALTGFMRLYNNRHWLTDVIGGAGYGILCAQAAYWLYPFISKALFRKCYNKNIYLFPQVDSYSKGVACTITF